MNDPNAADKLISPSSMNHYDSQSDWGINLFRAVPCTIRRARRRRFCCEKRSKTIHQIEHFSTAATAARQPE
jgi:hypothetical protein